jgi:endonuclease-8
MGSMAEGDTIYRLARQLQSLVGQQVVAARALPGPGVRRVADLSRLVGARVAAVDSRGKQLLIGFDNGLTIRSHLRMSGSWRRFRPGEPWKRPARRATAVIETPETVAVAFDTPVVELLTAAELRRSAPLRTLGPDLLGTELDAGEALRRLRERPTQQLGDALLDQRVMAGVGNVYKSEVAFLERLDPWSPVAAFDDDQLRGAIARARELLLQNVDGGRRTTTGRRRAADALWVYGRIGRGCRRCGTPINGRRQGTGARMTYWCSRCQPPPNASMHAPMHRER